MLKTAESSIQRAREHVNRRYLVGACATAAFPSRMLAKQLLAWIVGLGYGLVDDLGNPRCPFRQLVGTQAAHVYISLAASAPN